MAGRLKFQRSKRQKRIRAQRIRRMPMLQKRELGGYRAGAYRRVKLFPLWLLKTYRGILAGMVTMTMGVISAAPASAKTKTAVVQKGAGISSSRNATRGGSIGTVGRASVKVMMRSASLTFKGRGGEPKLKTRNRYTRIEADNGNVTYNFK